MKKLTVTVCTCAECTMNGAMDIIEAIEDLKKLKVQLQLRTQIEIITNRNLCGESNSYRSPVVQINSDILENCDTETVMSRILLAANKDVK